MSRKVQQAVLRIGVSLAALGVVLYFLRDKVTESLKILQSGVSWNWFLLAAAGYLAVQLIMAYRLYRIFAIQKVAVSYGQTCYLCFLGLFFNLFLPSALGGDVAKIYYAYKHSGKHIESATAILVDRLVGLMAISLIALTAIGWLQWQGRLPDPRIAFGTLFFLVVLGALAVFFSNETIARFFARFSFLIPSLGVREKIGQVYQALHGCKNHGKTLALGLLISFLGQGVLIFLYYWIGRSLGLSVPPEVFFALVPLISVASMAPSLGGLGVREAGAIYFLSLYMEPEMALAHSLLMNILIYGFGVISGLVFAFKGGLRSTAMTGMEPVQEGS